MTSWHTFFTTVSKVSMLLKEDYFFILSEIFLAFIIHLFQKVFRLQKIVRSYTDQLHQVIFLSKFDVFSRDPVFICVDTRIELGPLFNSQCYSDTHTIIPAGVYSFRHGIYVYLDGTETKETQGETKDVRYMTNIKGGQTRENQYWTDVF